MADMNLGRLVRIMQIPWHHVQSKTLQRLSREINVYFLQHTIQSFKPILKLGTLGMERMGKEIQQNSYSIFANSF